MQWLESILPGLAGAPNVHPFLVHFPVALIPAALLFYILAFLWEGEALARTGRWLLYLGTLGALAAAGTGWMAEESLEHAGIDESLVDLHRNIMIAATVLAVILSVVSLATARKGGKPSAALVGGVLLLTIILALGADRGALLVYGHGIGTAAPSPAPAGEPHEEPHEE